MKAIFGIDRIKKFNKAVVAVGVFDGVHRGHKNILKAVVTKARRIKGTSVVLTFWPHPQREKSLYSLGHRLKLMEQLGVEICIVINFNRRLWGMSAVNFIKKVLLEAIGAQYIYVGRNFSFGCNAEGNFKTLKNLSKALGFKLRIFDVVRIKDKDISSSYIRRLIKTGKLTLAQNLLTRPVSILGRVIKGGSIAKKIGFPTANIDPQHEVIPPSGVYAVRVILNNKKWAGICNVGTKPTFQRTGEKHIEVHIFNFQKNIYGKYLEIQFIRKLRNERKFASPIALSAQIKKDICLARKLLSLH